MAQVKVEIKGVHPKGASFSKVRHLASNSNKLDTESSIMLHLKTKDSETMQRIKEGYEIAIVKIF